MPFMSEVQAAPAGKVDLPTGGTWANGTEVGGLPEKAAPQSFTEQLIGFLSSPEEGKQFLKTVAGTVAQASDLGTSMIGGVLSMAPYVGVNTYALAKGESKKTAATAASLAGEQVLPQEFQTPWAKVAEALGPDAQKAYENNPIAWVMGKVSDVIGKGGKQMEKSTDIPSEHLEQLAKFTMSAMGVAGAKTGAVKAIEARTKGLNIDQSPFPSEGAKEGISTPEPSSIPSSEQPYRQPVAPTGEPLSSSDVIKASKERIAAVKAAVKTETPAEKANRMAAGNPISAGDALWTSGGVDFPVKVTGAAAKGPDGKMYTPVEHNGQPSYVPTEELRVPEVSQAQVGLPEPLIAQPNAGPQSPIGARAGEIGKTRTGEPVIIGQVVSALDSGVAKVKAGQGFLLSTEEKIALKASAEAGGKIVGPDGTPIGTGFTETGHIDPRLLAALGITSAAVWAALNPEDQDKLASIGLIGATMLSGEARALGPLKKDIHPYRSELLEKLPEGKTEFGVQQITDLLKKPELQAERPIFERVLANAKDGRISAHDLVGGFAEETANWKLTKEPTAQYSDYGLENIRPKDYASEPTPQVAETAVTSKYRLPDHMQVSDANHFGDDRLFGWTRSFEEDGIRHVVELQSDLAQHAKGLTQERRTAILEESKALPAKIQELEAKLASPASWGPADSQYNLGESLRQARLRTHELRAALEGAAVDSQLSPILKNWPRRLIREELKDAAGKGEQTVRFASADTVAKVEGWPSTHADALRAIQNYAGAAEYALAPWKEQLAKPNRFAPGHQSIYNRYAGEITRYLKGLNGVEVRDEAGHTWWEVPTTSVVDSFGRVKMLGKADPKLLGAIAVGVAAGAYLLNPDSQNGLALAAIGGVIAGKGGFKGMLEADLLKAAKEGKQGAFTELYRQNAKGAERMIQSYARSGVDVEAAVQEGFTAAFRNLDSFRGDSSFSTWVNRIVINKAKNALESIKNGMDTTEITPEMEQTLGHETTPASIAQNKLLGSRLDEAMGKVDPAFKEAFLMKEAEGLSYEEIADRQGVPIGTVRSRISRAKEQLQRALRDYADETKGPDFSQRGIADMRQKAAMVAVGGGAMLGAYLNPDEPWKGMLKGGGAGFAGAVALMNLKPKALLESVRRLQQSGPIVRIDDLIGQMVAQTKYGKVAVRQLTTAIAKDVPEVTRREAIYDYLEGEKSVKLSAMEKLATDKARAFFDELGGMAKNAGVVRKLVEDYVTRMYERPTADVMAGKSVLGEGSTSTPFSKPRAFKTRAEAEAAGYVLRTTDIASVLEAYSDSVTRAVAGKQLIDTLRLVKDGASALIEKAKKAPRDYVAVDHPALAGMLVHPDIAPDLRFVFDQHNFGAVVAGLEAINNTQKRMGVSLSLFHATALEHALLGGVSVLKSPLIGAKAFGQSFLPVLFGESIVTKMLDSGGLHPELKRMIDSGLEFSLERLGKSAIEEERPSMAYQVLGKASQWMDKTIPGAGKYTAGAVLELNHMFDQAMWGRFHTTLKAQTFLDKAAELYRNNAALVSKGKAELLSQAEIDKQAASFANDLYGGLNYYKIANEFQSRFGRELALQILSPTGRLGMRLLMFAPDWTISTTRAFVKGFGPRAGVAAAGAVIGSQMDTESGTSKLVGGALGGILGYGAARAAKVRGLEGTGIMGALPSELGGRPANLVDLHRQYFLRSAILYTVLVDTVNYQMSGHHLWDNKDPTRLDRGDGTTMQMSKHFMEPMHWILDPRKQAMGKASFLVKESASQLTDAEYWSPKGAPRMGGTPKDQDVSMGTRAAHAGRQFLPISAQGMELANPQKAGWSAVGMPVYGKTYEERAAAKEAARVTAIQRRIEKRAREGK